ncbi:MAG: TetR/AcrR family transcriptional regulator [Brevinematales bacterium]|nr:TetR/AcrR family transcriptional regulator [Brevinematales bacterium]
MPETLDDSILIPTKERLFLRAAELFSKDGYNGVSVRDICRAVGIKESSFYNHYPSKDALLVEVYRRFADGMNAGTPSEDMIDARVRAADPVEFWLSSSKQYYRDSVSTLEGLLWRIISMEQYRDPRAGEAILQETGRTFRMGTLIFSKMIEHKKIPRHDPELLAHEFFYSGRAIHLEYLVLSAYGWDTSEVEKRSEEHIRFFINKIILMEA